MSVLGLAAANRIIEAALSKAGKSGFKPMAVVVLDAGGHPLAFQRQDGASMLRYEIAFGKAYGALALGVGSRAVAKIAVDRPHFFTGLSGVSGGSIVPVPGGVLVRDGEGRLLGAVGITGDTSDNDETAAIAGIEAAGLAADPGA